MADQPLYASPPMVIGKHEWRIIVHPSNVIPGKNSTAYQWRRVDAFGLPESDREPWKGERDWPSYDFNDGTYGGLPRTLKKLYERHEAEIKAALQGVPYQSPQAGLFDSPPADGQAGPGRVPGDWEMVRHTARSDYGPDAYTLWPKGIIIQGLTEAEARLIEAALKLREALTLARRALNAAPRFRVDDTDSYEIAATVDQALADAGWPGGRPPEPTPPLPSPGLAGPTPGPAPDAEIVIFRKFPDGGVIALFPYVAATAGDPWPCGSYMHVGQHGAADPGIVADTLPASPEEYAALKAELEGFGYRLDVRQRFPSDALERRTADLQRRSPPVPSVADILADPKRFLSPEPDGGLGPEHGNSNGRKV